MRRGANDFVAKPFLNEELSSRIRECMTKKDPELEIARLKSFASALDEQNKKQMEQIESLARKQMAGVAGTHQAIWGAAAHNLKGEFLQIGHSLRAVRELADDSPDIQEECDLIERSVEYSQLLLRRLLDYLDIGRPKIESINALELLRRTELLVRPRLPSSVQLEITADTSMKEQIVSADLEQLMGVLLELINNAGNVLREKGGTIELKIAEINGELAISVKDNGPGIPQELRGRLFKEQVSSKSGLGLGLFLSNKVITALEGKLQLQDSSEKGTTFTILLAITSDTKLS
jgi:signal transduction histidine kinase